MDVFAADSDSEEDASTAMVEVVTAIRRVVRCRRVGLATEDPRGRALLEALDVTPSEDSVDVLISDTSGPVRRGGVLVTFAETKDPEFAALEERPPWRLYRRRRAMADAVGSPPWGPADATEHDRVDSIVAENDAAKVLRKEGVVFLPGFLSGVDDRPALDRFEECRKALLSVHGIDLLNPGEGEPTSYKELAMREDLRCDVRMDAQVEEEEWLLRARRIVRDAMSAPRTALRAGNFGRYNFDDSGPDAPEPLPVISAAGAVVSLPGATDQALHADTPHLYDHLTLPGHYFNLVTTKCQEPRAGHTAFVLGTHDLKTCADVLKTRHLLKTRLIRPRLEPGDAIIFDARILHFGLPNRSELPRALLYWNITAVWFKQDKKNWQHDASVFSTA